MTICVHAIWALTALSALILSGYPVEDHQVPNVLLHNISVHVYIQPSPCV